MCVKRRSATVPFDKKAQRHGQNVREVEMRDRAFCKKRAKARSNALFSISLQNSGKCAIL